MTTSSYNLAGRVALVTGAGGGIGRAIAIALARAGANVGVHWRSDRAGAEETLAAIVASGAQGESLQADLTDPTAATSVVDRVVERFGRLDILVNNAGDPVERTKIEDCPLDLWRRVFDVNMTSAFLVARQAIPHLKATGRGSIVNVISLSTRTGGANGAGPYAAAKGALEVFTRTLARELAPVVRANTLCPGVIETRHHEVHTKPDRMEQYRQETPLGRNGQADEVGQAALFLASDASSFTTGAILDVNGGRYLR